jgi:hypothetical protein
MYGLLRTRSRCFPDCSFPGLRLQTPRPEEYAALVAWVGILVMKLQRRQQQVLVAEVEGSHLDLFVQCLPVLA